MSRQVFAFDKPERFVAGTVGEPGHRTFFLQARGDGQVVSVALEKMQVALLADKLTELLDEARRRFAAVVPEANGPDDNEPLDSPLDSEFRVGALGLAWDADSTTVVIEAIAANPEFVNPESEEIDDEPDLDAMTDDSLDRLRVRLTPEQAVAFVARARRVVAAGRPPCPFCELPLDPSGHLCPRSNGYRGR